MKLQLLSLLSLGIFRCTCAAAVLVDPKTDKGLLDFLNVTYDHRVAVLNRPNHDEILLPPPDDLGNTVIGIPVADIPENPSDDESEPRTSAPAAFYKFKWKGSCHGQSAGKIFFIDPNTPQSFFAIVTAWHLYYPTQLRKGLKRAGFEIVTHPVHSCTWLTVDKVLCQGVKRGNIAYRPRYTDIHGVEAPEYLSDEMVWRARRVMQSTYPIVEISLILFFAFSPVWMLSLWKGIGLLRNKGTCCMRVRKKNKKSRGIDESDCEELVEVRRKDGGKG
jgi:hypothetical protein